jgi:hypothetical protein
MKTLSCTCRVCGNSISLQIDESEFFTDEKLVEMATCDRCYDSHDQQERDRIAKYHKAIERECQEPKQYKKPYAD